MKRKIDISLVRKGMYVVELDRPWRETPFLFQGFEITTDDELAELQKHCKHIHIDIEQGVDVDPQDRLGTWHVGIDTEEDKTQARKLQRQFEQAARGKRDTNSPVHADKSTIEQEMGPAREAERKTRNVIYNIMEDVRLGRSINTDTAKSVVRDMTESIIRNPDALVCLSQLKSKDEYTALHSLRVCILALAFGRHLGLDTGELNVLGLGALLHDIGKMRIPNEILNKPGKLTDEEFTLMKSHVPEGVRILEQTSGIPDRAIDVARYHHERFDGSGYASGLKGPEITDYGQIGAIVDCYDAITSDRAYHQGMSAHDALKRMYEWRIKDFHPGMIEQFIQCMGIYPIGSLVEMTTGSIGVVATINRERRLRPKVVLVLTPDKTPYNPVKVVDLYRTENDEGGAVLDIRHVLPNGTYGINPTEYLPIR